MTLRRYVGKNITKRNRKIGYVHRRPLSEAEGFVSISPAYQLLAAGSETADFTLSRHDFDTNNLFVSVRWTTSNGSTGVVQWGPGESDDKLIQVGALAETSASSVFTVTLSEPVSLVIGSGTATAELDLVAFTSRPYPINIVEALGYSSEALDGAIANSYYESLTEALGYSAQPMDGTLRDILIQYSYTEAVEYSAEPLDGELREILKLYGAGEYIEAVEYSAQPLDGELREILIEYDFTEALGYSAMPLDGTLETV